MGAVHWAPEVFNSHAPDLPTMEMLLKTGAELAAAKEALQAKGAEQEAVKEVAKAEPGLGA